jgi:hypothetical protein
LTLVAPGGYNSSKEGVFVNSSKPPSDQPVAEIQLKPKGAVVVKTSPKPAPGPAGLKIHARRPLPAVPDRADTDSDEKISK